MSAGANISLSIGQRVKHHDYKGKRVTGVVRTLTTHSEQGLMVDIILDEPIVIPPQMAVDHEIRIYNQYAPAHEFTPLDERDELVAELVVALTLQSKALERICLGGEAPSDVVDDALIATVNAAIANWQGGAA